MSDYTKSRLHKEDGVQLIGYDGVLCFGFSSSAFIMEVVRVAGWLVGCTKYNQTLTTEVAHQKI